MGLVMLSVIWSSPNEWNKYHITIIFRFFQYISEHRERRPLQEKWRALFISLSVRMHQRAADTVRLRAQGNLMRYHSERRRGPFFSHAWHAQAQISTHLNTPTASSNADALQEIYPYTLKQETPLVWVFEAKQMLMSHLSLSFTIFFFNAFQQEQWIYIIVCFTCMVANSVRFSWWDSRVLDFSAWKLLWCNGGRLRQKKNCCSDIKDVFILF